MTYYAGFSVFKQHILNKIVGPGLVAVIRASSAEHAARIADACVEGGVQALEVTFTVPNATAAIRKAREA